MYKNKVQYLIEGFTNFAFCLIILFRLYYYKENALIFKVFILAMSINMLLLSFLKSKGKWFKYKSRVSLGPTILSIVVVAFVIYFTDMNRIPAYVGILIPMLILLLAIFMDYKFNFKK